MSSSCSLFSSEVIKEENFCEEEEKTIERLTAEKFIFFQSKKEDDENAFLF